MLRGWLEGVVGVSFCFGFCACPDDGDGNQTPGSTEAVATSTSSSGAVDFPPIDVHGHRGNRGQVPPGNTLPSFISGLEAGVDVLEGDMRISSDGFVVLGHDSNMEGNGCTYAGPDPAPAMDAIDSLTLAEIEQWDCHPEIDGIQSPPSLADVLDLSAEVGFNLEFKVLSNDAVDVCMDALSMYDQSCGGCLAQRLIVQSFDWTLIEYAKAQFDGGAEGLFSFRGAVLAFASVPDELDAASAYAQIWSPSHTALTAAQVGAAHAAGMDVVPWTVNEEPRMEQLIQWGVEGIITDEPALLVTLQ